ncbi:thioredoxin domain-containing protein, partial [Corynebacterium diphtheriae]
MKQHPWVFVLFVSEYCEACQGASKRFERISEAHAGEAKSITLDTTNKPQKSKHWETSGTPTLRGDTKITRRWKGNLGIGSSRRVLGDRETASVGICAVCFRILRSVPRRQQT